MQAFNVYAEPGLLGTWGGLTPAHRASLSLLGVEGLIFIAISVRLLLGRKWAWYGLGWASLVLFLWNLRAWIPGRPGSLSLSLPIYSLIALLLSVWLLNRVGVRHYFSLTTEPPSWMKRSIRGRPVLMVVGIGLLLGMVILEVSGVLVYLASIL
jgi:hypothetical protein